jgi:ureidoglycolate dehydrogenase (NAD+)
VSAPAPLIAASALRDYLAAIFLRAGMPERHAADTAAMLLWAELRGVGSHGVTRVPRYLEMIDRGEMDPRAEPLIAHPAPAIARIDARRAPGAVAMRAAVAAGGDLARRLGAGTVVVARATHAGAIGMHASALAEQGLAAIVIAAGVPNMAYHGASVTSLATAPIAIAVPGAPDAPPLLLDMASATLAMGRLKQMQQAGQTLPEGWALDGAGAPTTDPARAAIPLPLGGPKGSGMSLLFECLTGLLSGAPVLAGFLLGEDRSHAQGVLVQTIDIAALRPLAEFRADIARLAGAIRALPRQQGVAELLLPGERGARLAARRAREGIPAGGPAFAELLGIGAQFGLPAPTLS